MKPFPLFLVVLITLLFWLPGWSQVPVSEGSDFESLKGKLSLPVDRFTSLNTYGQLLERLKGRHTLSGYTPFKNLTIRSDSSILVKSPAPKSAR